MIKVLVVDDSSVARDLLVYILKTDQDINVIGTAKNGKEAIDFIRNNKPDVITMDVNMPVMDGIEATKLIMETSPIPIIIISSHWDPKDIDDSFNALKIGAVAISEKPTGYADPRFQEAAANIIQNVKLMSEIKVITRKSDNPNSRKNLLNKDISPFSNEVINIKIIGIGCSTGGPVVLQKLLSSIKSDIKAPIVVIQHILPGFTEGFAQWLNQTSKVHVKIASQGELLEKGNCYLAPDGYHFEVDNFFRANLLTESTRSNIKPSVAQLFHSLVKIYGNNTLAILLTGMGKDGAEEMKELYNAGAITIAQDKDSSIVHGMPGEAIKLKAVKYILTPDEICTYINNI